MKTRITETELGQIRIEEKETNDDAKAFVGAIQLCFTPRLPHRTDGAKLQCFSVNSPCDSEDDGTYCWLFSWYKDGRNVNGPGER